MYIEYLTQVIKIGSPKCSYIGCDYIIKFRMEEGADCTNSWKLVLQVYGDLTRTVSKKGGSFPENIL
jgi:hypothetical protein